MSFFCSSLSLIVNVVTLKSVQNPVKINVVYTKYNQFDPYNICGFPGILTRLVNAKVLLDDQVN